MKLCKKTNLLWLISTLSLLLCVVVILNSNNGQQENLQQMNADQMNVSESSPNVISQVFKKYANDENFNFCAFQNLDNCIQELAREGKKDIECDDFILETSKVSCKQSQISADAVDKKDLQLCSPLLSGKEGCEFEVAIAIGSIDYDTEVCKKISEAYRVSCYNQIILIQSRNQKDIKICNALLEENDDIDSEKEFCIQEVEYIIQEDKFNEEGLQ